MNYTRRLALHIPTRSSVGLGRIKDIKKITCSLLKTISKMLNKMLISASFIYLQYLGITLHGVYHIKLPTIIVR